MKFTILSIALTFSSAIFSQTSPEWNSAEILQGLKKLKTVGSVLYVAAHPDDENTRLLAYLAKERNLRTGYLSLTRGDGGQNLIGNEQGEALGLIRTQELLAARRTDGAEQFFTRANDFGFSKNPEETLTIWDKEAVLADVVLTIRRFKPDVIICRFPTTGEGGHGHHTASAILSMEAFDLAADPTKFPEQLKEVQVWQAKRIFWNTFNFGGNNTTAEDQLKLDVGAYNPLLGLNYGEVAANSRSMHKSQGFGSAKQRGENIEYFKLLKGEKASSDLFEGVNQHWSRIAGASKLTKQIQKCIDNFDPQHPEKSISNLTAIYKFISSLDAIDATVSHWKKQKLEECTDLLIQCAGLWMEATAKEFSAVPGQELNLTAQIIARNSVEVHVKSIDFLEQKHAQSYSLFTNKIQSIEQKVVLPANTPYSEPYWLAKEHSVGMYQVESQDLIGSPENRNPLSVTFYLQIGELSLSVDRPITFKATDPVKGEVYRPFEVLPPATINISNEVFVFHDQAPKEISFTIKANQDNFEGTLALPYLQGWSLKVDNTQVKLLKKGDEQTIKGILTPNGNGNDFQLKVSLTVGDQSYDKSIRRIEYDHIPYQFILSEAKAQVVKVDLKLADKKIGYIPGAGDKVAESLTQLGYEVTILTDEMISKENLNQFSSIVTGIRAYNTNNRMPIYYDKLMDYVKQGGNLIVQYNTNNRIAPMEKKIGPYPFTITRERVTDDNAEVRFVQPNHPALNFPNKITDQDFENWIQERGIYFASDWDSSYQAILSMNDPNEKANEGSLIIGKYGKGNFVYTGLVFFRELPAGIPGAYRLFVNLLSLPKNQ